MRKVLWFAATAAIFMLPASSRCQQPDQSQQPQQQSTAPVASKSSQQNAATPSQTAPAAKQQDSLAAAARRAREQKKETPKAAKVFTNDNIPTQGGISAVGEAPASSSADNSQNASASAGPSAANGALPDGNDEKGWRSVFAKLHHKLDQDQSELDILQRELGTLGPQYYSDPTKALMQSVTRSDINEKTAKIDQKKADVQADNQAISDAEDALRKAGGDRGWAE